MTISVYMTPHPDKLNESGIKRVVEAYRQYLPDYGFKFVENDETADIIASHAASYPKPTVVHTHGLYWTADYSDIDTWQWQTNSAVIQAIRHAKEVTVPSAWVAESFQRDMRFTPNVVPHGIEWQDWQHNEPNEGYVLFNKNRTSDACDNSVLNDLIVRFPKVNFLSTFPPNHFSPVDLDNWPKNLKVFESGVVPHNQMKLSVQRTGVYLATTKETFGIGVLEAMAAGIPILGYAYGGNVELVEHGVNGYLARPDSLEDLYEGLDFCLKYRDTLGDNGREMAKAWTWDKPIEQVAEIYKRALEDDKPTVSVVIPVYNKPIKQVRRTIDSCLAQTFHSSEIIVIDDGSEDKSSVARLFMSYELTPEVKYIYQHNQGVAIARNNGISQTNSKYIVCLDADDWIESTFLERCVNELEKDRSLGVAYTGLQSHFEDGTSTQSRWPNQFNPDRQLSYNNKMNQIPTCCVFRREAWKRVGGYKSRYCPDGAGSEDAAFWSAITSIGYSAKQVTTKPLFNYSMDGGIVHANKEYTEVDWLSMYPWASDGQHPFASVATPEKWSHPVRQYDEPLVSVIIPVGPGHEKEVANALDSLEMQYFRKWEVIVVSDGTFLGEHIHKSYPYIKATNLIKNRGAGLARNRGVEIARAPLILFLDADDVLSDPNTLDKMVQAWNNEQAIIYSDYLGKASWNYDEAKEKLGDRLVGWLNKTNQAVIRHYAADYDCHLAQRQPLHNLNNPKMPYFHWALVSCLIPKVWHNAVGGFDETMETWEDVDYHWRLARAGYCFHRVPEPLFLYNYDGGHRRHKSAVVDDATRQKHQKMIEYLKRKYKGLKTVMCNCGGKSVSTHNVAVTEGETMAGLFAPKLQRTVRDDEMVLVEFSPPYTGNRDLTGDATGIKYGYGRRKGEQFNVHQADIDIRPTWYKSISEMPQVVEVEEVKTTLPEPTPIANFYPADLAVRFGLTEKVSIGLFQAGFNTLETIRNGDLTKVKGIGKALERKIKAKLNA